MLIVYINFALYRVLVASIYLHGRNGGTRNGGGGGGGGGVNVIAAHNALLMLHARV